MRNIYVYPKLFNAISLYDIILTDIYKQNVKITEKLLHEQCIRCKHIVLSITERATVLRNMR